jgi:uncharacterized protein (DUF58 family)
MVESSRMKNWWRERSKRFHRWLEDRVRERVTFTGLVFMLALTLTGLAAFASANNLLFLMLAAMLATMLVNSFLSRIGIAGLELDIRLPDHICARRTVAARLLLRNEKRWMPSFSIRLVGVEDSVFSTQLYFPVVPGGAVLETTVDVRFDRRGMRTEDSFLFSSRFPFGFAERRARVTMKQDVLVYPSIEPQPGFRQVLADVNGDAETLFRGRGHDFYRIRPYQPMESARHVDWRATAHTNSLQVREFAQEQEHLITLFLDLEVPREHEEWFEKAIECCAFLAWECSQRGARVRFRTQDFEVITPVESDVYAILKYLALVECRHRAAPLRNLDEQSVAIVFTASPLRLQDYGWNGSRLLDPGHWAFPTAS